MVGVLRKDAQECNQLRHCSEFFGFSISGTTGRTRENQNDIDICPKLIEAEMRL